MTSQSKLPVLSPTEREQYGLARARDMAFSAVHLLWLRRRNEGMQQRDIAAAIGRDPSRVSKELSGPGNWTMKTLGGLVEALGGELEIVVLAIEDPISDLTNWDAYSGYDTDHTFSGSSHSAQKLAFDRGARITSPSTSHSLSGSYKVSSV